MPGRSHRSEGADAAPDGAGTASAPTGVTSGEALGATRERILDAAEQVFATHDFAEATVRPITAAAGVNLAAVNYHFGSKEALYLAVLRRRLEPLTEQRLSLLDTLEAQGRDAAGSPTPVPVAGLVRVLLEPMRPYLRTGDDPHPFLRCMGRLMLNPPAFALPLLREQFGAVLMRLGPALQRSLPHLTRGELLLRGQACMGAIHFTLTRSGAFRAALFPQATHDIEAIYAQLVTYCTAAFSAPAATPAEPASSAQR